MLNKYVDYLFIFLGNVKFEVATQLGPATCAAAVYLLKINASSFYL
jgi:hypothetical protein